MSKKGKKEPEEFIQDTDAYFEDGEQKWITLELEDGRTAECAVMGIYKGSNKKNYIAVVEEEKLESGEPYFYRYAEDENGDPVLSNIEDDEEWEIACDGFEELLDELEFEKMSSEDDD